MHATLFAVNPAAEVVLAYWSAGLAVFFPACSTFLAQRGLYLEDLYLKPRLRGSGIGLALLKHVAAAAATRGCGRLEWGVLDWNQPAIHFYRNLGAVAMDAWTRYRLAGDALTSLAASA